MGMSPSRMQQTQGMMGGHANNMVGQTPNQNQFMNQTSFSPSATGMNVNQAQQSGQAAPQVSGLSVKEMRVASIFLRILSVGLQYV